MGNIVATDNVRDVIFRGIGTPSVDNGRRFGGLTEIDRFDIYGKKR